MTASYELRFDTGRVSLDLLATVGGALGPAPVERLDTPERLGAWLCGAGVLPEGTHVAPDAEWLAAFHRLRALLHRVVHAELAPGGRARPADLAALNRIAAAGVPAVRVVRDAAGVPRRRFARPAGAEELAAAVADDAVRLLTGPERAQLRECGGEECDLVYLDGSRGRRRQWCSSAACGNRERVSRHRARHREDATG